MARRNSGDLCPFGVENELAAGNLMEVTRRGVVGHVPFEEHHAPSAAGESGDQAAPERRMAIAPGRAHRQPEDDQLHGDRSGKRTSSFKVISFAPHSPKTSVEIDAGEISMRSIEPSGRPIFAATAVLITSEWLT